MTTAGSGAVAIIEAGEAPGEARLVIRIGQTELPMAHVEAVLFNHRRFIEEAIDLVRAGKARRVAVEEEGTGA